jgi:hypothetical protein
MARGTLVIVVCLVSSCGLRSEIANRAGDPVCAADCDCPAESGRIRRLGPWQTGTSHPVVEGASRLLLVFLHSEDDEPGGTGAELTALTYGGNPMARVPLYGRSSSNTGNTQNAVEAWYLAEVSVATASGDLLVPTLSRTPTETPMYSHILLDGVAQTSPFGDGDIANCLDCNPIATGPFYAGEGDFVVAAADHRELGSYTPLNGFIEGAEQSFSSHTGTTAYIFGTGGNVSPAMDHVGGVFWQSILAFAVQPQSD